MDDPGWTRPYFEGGGGDPFVFFVVFGPSPTALEISTERHRVDELPETLVIDHQAASVAEGFLSGPLADQVLPRWQGAPVEQLTADGCTILRGDIPDPVDLLWLRNTIGIVTALLEAGGLAVLSLQSLGLHTPASWIDRIFLPDDPHPRRHVLVLHSEEEHDDSVSWVHTRGMRLFGRPDVSVHEVPPASFELALEVVNRFIEAQAFGLVIPEGQPVRVDGVPDGMVCHHAGDLDDPDFNNVHVDLVWPT